MITVQALYTTDAMKNIAKVCGRLPDGVLTLEQARAEVARTGRLCVNSGMKKDGKDGIVFFSGQHLFGYTVLPDSFVPGTMAMPYVTWVGDKRVELTDPMEVIEHLYKDNTLVQSDEELINLVNSRLSQ